MEGKEGYDSSNTLYSPDGRMYQVEYARQAINRGTITCGIVYKDGVLLLVDKKVRSHLIEPDSIEKLFQIDTHIGCSMSGLVADARVLVDEVRAMSQDERYYYGEIISLVELVKDLSSIVWTHASDGGGRPLGMGLLIGGMDRSGPHLFSTDPSGAYQELFAGAIGSKSDTVEEILKEKYKKNLKFKDALELLLACLKSIEETDGERNLELAKITSENGFERFSHTEIKKMRKA